MLHVPSLPHRSNPANTLPHEDESLEDRGTQNSNLKTSRQSNSCSDLTVPCRPDSSALRKSPMKSLTHPHPHCIAESFIYLINSPPMHSHSIIINNIINNIINHNNHIISYSRASPSFARLPSKPILISLILQHSQYGKRSFEVEPR